MATTATSALDRANWLEKVGAYTIAMPFAAVLGGLAMVWQAYVLATICNWFLTEWFGLPPLTTSRAIVLLIVRSAFSGTRDSTGHDRGWGYIALLFIRPAILLLVAWAYHRSILMGWIAY